jgi:prophage maintenance system killer protein
VGGWGGSDEIDDRGRQEMANALVQARRLTELIAAGLADRDAFEVEKETICELNALAVAGLADAPGALRVDDVIISGSRHEPPPWQQIPALLEAMLDHLREAEDVIHAAAFALWRINWIHPFENGNGRTARAVAYLILSVGIGTELPGDVTLLERLVAAKYDYLDGLEVADRAWAAGQIDVSDLEALLRRLLAEQTGER